MTVSRSSRRKIEPDIEPTSDLALLRRYEPVLAFTEGEMFFPMRVEGYIEKSSLIARTADGQSETVAHPGELTPGRLAGLGAETPTRPLSLRFVQKSPGGAEYRRWAVNRPRFTARGRLARVGLLGRFVDAIYRMTFLLRGRVPGGTVAIAQTQYADILAHDPTFAYHGRVIRGDQYTILNYQFFYAMNDWRSSFFGANDHEADWEQIFVYLTADADGELEPAWVAYASHDYYGCDLRRRWDDPDLTMVGRHPVVFVGAGSHASYFQAGEYITEVDIRPLKPLSALGSLLSDFWRNVLGQGDPETIKDSVRHSLSVPFIDYARGDGVRIGPGQATDWTPVVINDDVDWVNEYRGLWGLDTQDVFAGERAPAGPKYNRDGSVRRSWYDAVGWADLDREPLPVATDAELSQRIDYLEHDATEATEAAASIRETLPQLALEARALQGVPSARSQLRECNQRIDALGTELNELTAREEQRRAAARACRELQERVRAGLRPGPKDHIHRLQTPEPAQTFREGRIAELWAAVSIGSLFLVAAVLLAVDAPWFTALIVLVGGAVLVDHVLRGTIVPFLLSATIVLALLTSLVLVYETFWALVLVALASMGLLILAGNLREVKAR
jgi:hypothetical protein